MDDLSPVDDRDDLERATEAMTSGWRWGWAWQSGAPSWARGLGGGRGADTHRQVRLQLSLDPSPVVFIIVHQVVARHIEVQQEPLIICGFEQVILDCGERPELGGAAQKATG